MSFHAPYIIFGTTGLLKVVVSDCGGRIGQSEGSTLVLLRWSYSFSPMLFTTTGTKMRKFFVEWWGSRKYSSTPRRPTREVRVGQSLISMNVREKLIEQK